LSQFAGAPKRVTIAMTANLVQHAEPIGVGRRIIVLPQEPQTANAILLDQAIDVASRRLAVIGRGAAHRSHSRPSTSAFFSHLTSKE